MLRASVGFELANQSFEVRIFKRLDNAHAVGPSTALNLNDVLAHIGSTGTPLSDTLRQCKKVTLAQGIFQFVLLLWRKPLSVYHDRLAQAGEEGNPAFSLESDDHDRYRSILPPQGRPRPTPAGSAH